MHIHQQKDWNNILFYRYQSYHLCQWTIEIGKIIKDPLMRCIFTNRTIGMTSFSTGTNPTIGSNGPSELTHRIRLCILDMSGKMRYSSLGLKNTILIFERKCTLHLKRVISEDVRIIEDPTQTRRHLAGTASISRSTRHLSTRPKIKTLVIAISNLSYQLSVNLTILKSLELIFCLSYSECMPLISFKFSQYRGTSKHCCRSKKPF